MTAVAPPPNFQPISRTGWSAPNGSANGINPMADDVSRMFMPSQRRGIQRTPSSSSVSSTSSNGTITSNGIIANGISSGQAADGQTWAAKKKPTRGLWPPSESKPVAGLSTARPQPVASQTSGPSAASAISALHTPSSMLPSQHNGQTLGQQNGQGRPVLQAEGSVVLYLIPMNGTFERKTITVPFYPDVLKIGRQTNQKTQPTALNGFFDSKVLSRQHAEIWADKNGKVWIRDVKSSNGTFVNGQRLSQENRDSEPHELREQDMLELGIDIVSEDQKTIVHHKVAARVEHAGFYTASAQNIGDLNFGDLDASSNGGLVNGGFGQGLGQMRNRQGSQGSIGSVGRPGSIAGSIASNMTGMSQQRHNTFWLQPISMEQVVKKLNSELKLTKQQTHDLQRASTTIESLLTSDPKKDGMRSPPAQGLAQRQSPVKNDIKARFSDPPAPPPQAPLPEKPDVPSYQPVLRRNDTEKPMSFNSSPGRLSKSDSFASITTLNDPQSVALAEALASAKKDIEAQNARLRELEQIIEQEKRAREAAEEKASRLEAEHRKEPLTPPQEHTIPGETEENQNEEGPQDPVTVDDSTVVDNDEPDLTDPSGVHPLGSLHSHLDTVLSEMGEVRAQMERYRLRAEAAEAQSAKDRETLADMIEKLRAEQRQEKSSRTTSQLVRRTRRSRAITSEKDTAHSNGHVVGDQQEVEPETAEELQQQFSEALTQLLTQRGARPDAASGFDLASRVAENKAPLASCISVLIVGVAMMAWLNSWPKGQIK